MSRPLTRGEPADHVLRFRVTRREYATLTAYACANSVTVSQLITEAVAEFTGDLTDGEQVFTAASRAPSATPPRR